MKLRERTAWAVAVLVLFIVAGVMHQAKAGAQLNAGILRDSIEAANDRTRAVTSLNAILGANVQAFQRRAIQQTQRADSIDRALKLERKGKAELTLQVEDVRALNQTAVRVMTDSADNVRQAFFHLEDLPGDTAHPQLSIIRTIDLDVAVPRPPKVATMNLAVSFKPVPLGFRVHCGAVGEKGVRPASLTVLSPKWLKVDVGAVEWDPWTCNVPPAAARAWWKHWQPWAFAGLAYAIAR